MSSVRIGKTRSASKSFAKNGKRFWGAKWSYTKGRVRRIAAYRISLHSDAGCLTALVSKSNFDRLSLREGNEALASFSPESVHAI
jgi:hypothetical protein